MHLIRRKPVLLTVLAALGLSALAFAAHLHVDADDHVDTCALCSAAHHAPAVAQSAPILDPGLSSPAVPGDRDVGATGAGIHAAGAPRAPPLS